MATLRSKNTVPPRGFAFIVPESKLTITEESLDSLVRKVIQHRVHIGTAPTDYAEVELEIQRQICSRLSEAHCRSEGIADEWKPVKDRLGIPNPMTVLQFSKAAIDWIASGAQFVPIEEAKRRAAICRMCPCNQPLTGCKCGSFFKVLAKTLPAPRTLPGLGVCLACGCSLQLKVNVPKDFIAKADAGREISYPVPHCWVPGAD